MHAALLHAIRNPETAERATGRQFPRTTFVRRTARFTRPPEFATSFWANVEIPLLDDITEAEIALHGTKHLGPEGDDATAEVDAERQQLIQCHRELVIWQSSDAVSGSSGWATRILTLGFDEATVGYAERMAKEWPTDAEWKAIQDYRGAASALGLADKLFVSLRHIPRVKTKLDIAAYQSRFEERVQQLHSDMDDVIDGLNEICDSDKLPKVLAYICAFFNRLNYGELYEKYVPGFRLSWLPKVADTKSFVDNERTFLALTVKHIKRTAPDLASFPTQLGKLEALVKHSQKKVLGDFTFLQKGLEAILEELESSKTEVGTETPPPDVWEAKGVANAPVPQTAMITDADFADSITAKRKLSPLLTTFRQKIHAFHGEAEAAIAMLREKRSTMLLAVGRLNKSFGEAFRTEMDDSVEPLAAFVKAFEKLASPSAAPQAQSTAANTAVAGTSNASEPVTDGHDVGSVEGGGRLGYNGPTITSAVVREPLDSEAERLYLELMLL